MSWTTVRAEGSELGETFPVALPAFVMALYGGAEVNAAGRAVFETWHAMLPRQVELFYLNKSARRYRKVTPAVLNRIRTSLEKLDEEGQFYMLKDVDGFGVQNYCFELNMGMNAASNTPNRIHASFPVDDPDRLGLDVVIDRFRALADSARFDHGKAGYGFSLDSAREWEQIAMPIIFAAARRYLALDVRDRATESILKGKLKGPGWLTYLRRELHEELGGDEGLRAAGDEPVAVLPCQHGVLLRAGERPPVGDSNRRAPDLGPMCKVDRFIRPLRIEKWIPTGLFRADEDEANAWFERLEQWST